MRCSLPQLPMGPFKNGVLTICDPDVGVVTACLSTQPIHACGIVTRSALLSLARVICRALEKRGGAKTLEAWCVIFRKCDGTGRIGVEETYTS